MAGEPKEIVRNVCPSDSSHLVELRDTPPTLCYSQVLPIQQQSQAAHRATISSRHRRKYMASNHDIVDQTQIGPLRLSSATASGQDEDAYNERTIQPCLVRII